jgi:hypothetical protein
VRKRTHTRDTNQRCHCRDRDQCVHLDHKDPCDRIWSPCTCLCMRRSRDRSSRTCSLQHHQIQKPTPKSQERIKGREKKKERSQHTQVQTTTSGKQTRWKGREQPMHPAYLTCVVHRINKVGLFGGKFLSLLNWNHHATENGRLADIPHVGSLFQNSPMRGFTGK